MVFFHVVLFNQFDNRPILFMISSEYKPDLSLVFGFRVWGFGPGNRIVCGVKGDPVSRRRVAMCCRGVHTVHDFPVLKLIHR